MLEVFRKKIAKGHTLNIKPVKFEGKRKETGAVFMIIRIRPLF